MATEYLQSVPAADAAARFPELLARVEGGEEFTITGNHGPIAKLIPFEGRRLFSTTEERTEAIHRWKEARKDIGPLGGNIKDLINEGRP